MKVLWRLVFGESPKKSTIALVGLAVELSFLGVMATGAVALTQLTILACLASDIAGGIVANSSKSTRVYWAKLPKWVVPLFVSVHLAEIPLVFLLAGHGLLAYGMALGLMLKIGAFLFGQGKYRESSIPVPVNT